VGELAANNREEKFYRERLNVEGRFLSTILQIHRSKGGGGEVGVPKIKKG